MRNQVTPAVHGQRAGEAASDDSVLPNQLSAETYLEGSAPSVLGDRVLHPSEEVHLAAHASQRGGSRVQQDGSAGPDVPHAAADDDESSADELSEGVEPAENDRRGQRSTSERSTSSRRRLKWYQRPSPYWFFPGVLSTSISLGMIIAPKIEIYTELVCRSIDPQRSGTTLPAPISMVPGIGGHVPAPGGGIVGGDRGMINASAVSSGWTGEMDHHQTVVSQFVAASMRSDSLISPESIINNGAKEDDSWSKQCRRSSVVQQQVARLATILTLIMGILSALTTGFWGSLSDRRGRKPIIALALCGTIFMDAVFLIVVNYHDVVGYQFLLFGPLVDGLLGGMSTMTAATNAYVTDSTESGSRAKIFSVMGALLFAGIALGPTLGALLVRITDSVLAPFYVALAMHIFFLLCALILIPESLSPARRASARERHALEKKLQAEAEAESGTGVWTKVAKRGLGFLSPLTLLLPKQRTGDETEEELPILERGRFMKSSAYASAGSPGRSQGTTDWELTKIGLAYASFVTVISIMQVKILYAGYKFSWGIQENGLYLSFIGTCRVIVLIGLLPLGIKLFRTAPPLPLTPIPEDDDEDSEEMREWNKEKKYLKVVHDSHFDLSLARMSICLEICAYTLLSLNTLGSPLQFIIASGISSLAGGTSPALQSLALALTSPRDTGRLFASLGVLSCVFAQIIGPVFFLLIYVGSINTYPELVFLAGGVCFCISLALLYCIRLSGKRDEEQGVGKIHLTGESELGVQSGAGRSTRGRGRSMTRKISTHALQGR